VYSQAVILILAAQKYMPIEFISLCKASHMKLPKARVRKIYQEK
jgi:hypothetical protein